MKKCESHESDPNVENAVKHGVSSLKHGGIIKVLSKIKDTNLVLLVKAFRHSERSASIFLNHALRHAELVSASFCLNCDFFD